MALARARGFRHIVRVHPLLDRPPSNAHLQGDAENVPSLSLQKLNLFKHRLSRTLVPKQLEIAVVAITCRSGVLQEIKPASLPSALKLNTGNKVTNRKKARKVRQTPFRRESGPLCLQ